MLREENPDISGEQTIHRMVFGDRLLQARTNLKLSQETLAKAIGTTARSINRWEHNQTIPQHSYLVRLCQVLQTTPEALLGIRSEEPEEVTTTASPWPDIPIPLTPFIGRESEVEEVSLLLQRSDVRLLTLTGPGGVGKTRLGLQILTILQDRFPDGVCFLSFEGLSDPDLVIPTLAQALGIAETGTQPLIERLQRSLRAKHALILLDNFEQVIVASSQLAVLLATCPQLKLLITSRALLHLRGEHVYEVSPLALPDLNELPPLSSLIRSPAVALFLHYAQAIRPDFQLTESNSRSIVAICARLDGLPLAIELATVHLKILSPQALLTHLDYRLHFLEGGARDAPLRQQSLWHTLTWSYNLLTKEEQQLFRWLSVFVAGCSIEAAQVFCDHLSLPSLAPITSLIDKSLLRRQSQTDGEIRLFLLETIREFGLECLDRSEERELAQGVHTLYYLSLAEAAEPKLTGAEEKHWLQVLDQERENLRAAMAWTLEQGNEMAEIALRLGGALWRFWWARGYISEGRQFLSKALLVKEQVKPSVCAKAYSGAAMLAFYQDDYAQTEMFCDQSLTLFRALEDRPGIAATLNLLGQIATWTSKYPKARDLHKEALALLRREGDQWGIGSTLGMLASVITTQGEYAQAYRLAEEALAIFQMIGDTWGMGFALHQLARCVFLQGDEITSRTYAEESLTFCKEIGDKGATAYTLGLLGEIALFQQKISEAQTCFQECLTLHKELEDRWGVARVQSLFAKLALLQGNPSMARTFYLESLYILTENGDKQIVVACLEGLGEAILALGGLATSAAHLLGAAASLRACIGVPLSPIERVHYERIMTIIRAKLDHDHLKSAWREGECMTLIQIIAEVEQGFGLKNIHASTHASQTSPSSTFSGLTPREIDVLRLVAEGLTDRQIAEKLVLSSRTIGTHLRSVYNKLGVSSRAMATRFAVEHQLLLFLYLS